MFQPIRHPRKPFAERCRADRGDALVEFALSSIVFFLLVFGTLEFGIAIWRYNVVANVAKEAVRRAAVCGSDTALSSSDCNIQSFVSGRSYGMTVTATTTPSDLSTLKSGDVVTVQVQSTVSLMSGLVPHRSMTLRSAAKMIAAR